jgi:hypothetical protein
MTNLCTDQVDLRKADDPGEIYFRGLRTSKSSIATFVCIQNDSR